MALLANHINLLAQSIKASKHVKLLCVPSRNIISERVKVRQGELKGKIEELKPNSSFISFKGIPFAKPPVGELRFKAPQPPVHWNGVRDATEHGEVCPQMDMLSGGIIEGNEDCLFLNVYAPIPKQKMNQKFPVVIYFHGGAFMSGSGNANMYGPEYLMSQDVVLVTVNYRLEVFGFLCLYNEDVPGNAGLKDQVAAMKWVKENISEFGGDANNVTIYGTSAGGACVTYHMFSPICEVLFHKVISQSGVCISDWAYALDSKERAFRLGKIIGKDTNDSTELVKFFRSIPATDLIKVTGKTMTADEKRRGLPIKFCPVVEREFPGQEAYLTQSVFEKIQKGQFRKVPLLIGYNSHEGISMLNNAVKKMDEINNDFERYIPSELALLIPQEESSKLAEKIKKFYFASECFSTSTLEKMALLQSDCHFIYNIYRFSKLISKYSPEPVYLFKFSCDSKLNIMKAFTGYDNIQGASHADEIFYTFKSPMLDEDLDPNTEPGRLIAQVVRIWTNMAKYGNPTPHLDNATTVDWKPISNLNGIEYMDIGSKLQLKINPEKERMDFWDGIYEDVYKNHFQGLYKRSQ